MNERARGGVASFSARSSRCRSGFRTDPLPRVTSTQRFPTTRAASWPNSASADAATITLGIQRSTVSNQIQNILSKLGVHGKPQAVCAAQRCGLL